ncbi:prepilin-type N-terminal cleavage/methylation domain-containing protein [Shewanella avicenniae]|uniref:Prepilin-type N-terminal cleavage/methylation domain-containing protein n=1 Tax=Shewanella avicenniae TaxID=2814294 RepID=A0ABX7QP96_9GAMM|nr:prepilin-type N-terminal cleavage/methylation domain-containing protein [Shewanella avicenniae]QSX33301.1 prepilin-type N-terminal cleavage/methylation domain-containing protein [Shewanella avicenniae]
MHKSRLLFKATQTGFTLIELMVSLTLGLVVMLGASQIFISVNRAYTETQRFAQLQGDLSLISDMLASDTREASTVNIVNDESGNSTLTLTVASGNIVYNLANGNLNRTQAGVTESMTEQAASFTSQCVAPDLSTSCTSPIMLTLAVGLNSSDGTATRVHLVEFNVAIRNNVLAIKFAS